MKLPRIRRWRNAKRGQALVEMAVILPLLLLMLLLAIDFGRVFFGWVALNNASRIAANEAGWHPDAWQGAGNPVLQAIYRDQVIQDMQAINCAPPGGGTWDTTDVPNPTFSDVPGTATTSPYELGDHASVTLSCRFSFITPLVGLIVGNPMPINATAVFPVKGGSVAGVPLDNQVPSGCLDKTVPNMVGLTVANARAAWTGAGFTGTFTPDTTAGKDAELVTAQTTSPSSSPGTCLVATATVTVSTSGTPTCTNPNATIPNLVGLTVASARTTWYSAGFNSNTFSPASGSDSDIVSAQTTSPVSSPGDCKAKTTTVTVTHTAPPPGQCTAPQLLGIKANSGQSAYTTAGFTGSYTITHPPQGNYNIQSQSLVAGQSYSCDSDMIVYGTATP